MNSSKGKTVSRVLIADDDPVIRHWLTSILEGEGHGVVSMNDGRDAYRLLQGDADFAGAVFDMSMPYLEGSDLIRFMRTEKRLMRIPVMLITAESDIKLLAKGLAAGATILLPKPFTRKRLEQMLRMMLGVAAVTKPAVTKPAVTKPTVTKPAVTKPTELPTATRRTFASGSEEKPAIALPSGPVAEPELHDPARLAEGAVDLSVLTRLEDDEGSVDSDLVIELIDLYLGNAAGQVNEIKAAVAKKRQNQLKQLAHALKGSSLTMGANLVAKLCAELEQANIRNSNEVAELVQKLESAFAEAGEIFKSERSKRIIPVAA
ncbi:MAG TPA: response regulator [Pyrinomonadaceae bacterium]|nr:response regulator [Pyrinomonadaceae bacterium]